MIVQFIALSLVLAGWGVFTVAAWITFGPWTAMVTSALLVAFGVWLSTGGAGE